MKRLLSIIMLIVCVLVKADAQYYSVNYDKQTVAAMAATYGTEAVAEAYYNEQVQNILKHYNAAEVASAGIYASKFLERKAMTELGIWNSRLVFFCSNLVDYASSSLIFPSYSRC